MKSKAWYLQFHSENFEKASPLLLAFYFTCPQGGWVGEGKYKPRVEGWVGEGEVQDKREGLVGRGIARPVRGNPGG